MDRLDSDSALIHQQAQMKGGQFNMDAGESLYFARQLEYIRSKIYDVKRPLMSALKLFPIDSEVPEWAEKVTYRMYDGTAIAKIIASYADDLPMVGVNASEFSSPIKSIGNGYGWSTAEVRAAIAQNRNLRSDLATLAKRGHDIKVNQIAWFGDAVAKLPGFLTNPNIPVYTIPANGTGASKLWTTKTPDQILDDLNGLANSVYLQSMTVHQTTQIWMPHAMLSFIKNKIRGSNSDATIWKVWTDANPGIELIGVVELGNVAQLGGVNVMVAVQNSIENFQLVLPMPFREEAPQAENLTWKVPCESRVGGVVIEYPFAFAMATGM